jgi:hypothetical protein
MGKNKALEIMNSIPDNYSGPVYWGLCYNGQQFFVKWVASHHFKFLEKEGRLEKFYDGNGAFRWKYPGESIYTSGTVFDNSGNLLPEWHQPLKAKWKIKTQMPEYVRTARSAIVSERVYALLESAVFGRHTTFPIDLTLTDGSVERRYLVFFGRVEHFIKLELHPEANQLMPKQYDGGTWGYQEPEWLRKPNEHPEHFGFLDRGLLGERNWFEGVEGTHYFSNELFEKLRGLGDIWDNSDAFFAIGVEG